MAITQDTGNTTYKSKVKCKDFINPGLYQARQAANMLLAGGYSFTSEDEKLTDAFSQFEKINNLKEYMVGLETRLSQDGREILSIDKIGENAILTLADPHWYNRVGKAYSTPVSFIIHKTVREDDKTRVIKETWTDKEVKRELVNPDDELTLQGLNTKLPEELRIKEHEVHNYGFIPVMEMFNLPYVKIFGDHLKNDWKHLADDAPGRELIQLINNVLTQLHKEVYLNTTKVFGTFDQTVRDKAQADADAALGMVVEQVFIMTKQREGGGAPVEVAPGDPKLTEYITAVKELLNEYENLSNYSGRNDKREQQTVEETSTTQKKELATTAIKRDMRNVFWGSIIQRVFVLMGVCSDLDDKRDDWTFTIKEATIKPREQQLNESILAIQNGLSTTPDELQTLYDLNETEAKKKAEEIKGEQEEKQAQEIEHANALLGDDVQDDEPNKNKIPTKDNNEEE